MRVKESLMLEAHRAKVLMHKFANMTKKSVNSALTQGEKCVKRHSTAQHSTDWLFVLFW